MSDITLTVSAPGPTVDLTADAPGAVTVTVESGGGVSSHAALPDLATSGHPASAIAFTPTGSIAATTVQAAVAEVATDAAAAYQPLDSDLTAIAALTTPATTISGAAQKASNLSDLASASSARTNLGLGGAATLSVGTSAGTVAAGDDSRFVTSWLVPVNVYLPPAARSGFGTISINASRIGNASRSGSVVQNSYIEWNLLLGAGTWAVDVITSTYNGSGIITVSIDGSSVGTIDLYSASVLDNVQQSLTGISVAATGVKAVRLTMATKNASSSAYDCIINGLQLRRTA